jgi:hypothetical protein
VKSIHEKYWVNGSFQLNRDPYWTAQEEHAFLLRCEGLTFKEINARVGGCIQKKIFREAYRLNRALRKTRFRIEV